MVINLRRHLGGRARQAANQWRVFWRGADITRAVFYLDGRRKIARCYSQKNGRAYLSADGRRVVTETKHGVRIVRRSR